jgi:hypothetical protein
MAILRPGSSLYLLRRMPLRSLLRALDFHVRSKQALISAQKHRHSCYGPEWLRTCETPSTDFLGYSYSQKKEKKENKLGTVK